MQLILCGMHLIKDALITSYNNGGVGGTNLYIYFFLFIQCFYSALFTNKRALMRCLTNRILIFTEHTEQAHLSQNDVLF